jgi:phosphatidyl-myo-inositol dimannoside synthase
MPETTKHHPIPQKTKLLLVARTYPPLVGGMEKFASDFYHHLGRFTEIGLIANRIGKKRVFHFFFKVMVYLVRHAKHFDIIHFNDAILSPLIPVIRLFSDARVTVTVHGLDIIYQPFGYQHLVIPFLRQADKIFPVSVYTKAQCETRQIPPAKLRVIPNGLTFDDVTPCPEETHRSLTEKIKIPLQNKNILLSLGRLIDRKGHVWFIENVFMNLPQHYCYVIAGDGPAYKKIAAVINRLGLADRVMVLGYVSEPEKACLFEMADLFIMPNIIDQADQEGFGIVLLEAGSHALPSIATDIEGIRDAVIDGVTGVLVDEKDAHGFLDAITHNPIDRSAILDALRAKYDWKIIRQTYLEEFNQLIYPGK